MIDEELLLFMAHIGGSFVRKLVELYFHADFNNKLRIESCFRDYFDKYREMYIQIKYKGGR